MRNELREKIINKSIGIIRNKDFLPSALYPGVFEETTQFTLNYAETVPFHKISTPGK